MDQALAVIVERARELGRAGLGPEGPNQLPHLLEAFFELRKIPFYLRALGVTVDANKGHDLAQGAFEHPHSHGPVLVCPLLLLRELLIDLVELQPQLLLEGLQQLRRRHYPVDHGSSRLGWGCRLRPLLGMIYLALGASLALVLDFLRMVVG